MHFSPDSEHLAVEAVDPVGVMIVDRSGEQVAFLPEDGDRVIESVRFSRDGRHVAVSDGSPIAAARVWTLDRDELVEIARQRLVRTWTTAECSQYLHVDTCPA